MLGERPWGLRYYAEILPELLAELDGTRPYVPGSPFSPDGPDGPIHPNHPGHGLSHIWDVWNRRDYADYESWRPRFVSEFGYQAPACWPTLVTAVGGPLDPADPALEHHQRARDGAAKLQAGLERHLPHPPASGPAWYFATQLLQARALTTGVTHLRSLHDLCSGAIWWQLNDLWPAVSWSVVDVRGRRKLAWHALQRAFDSRLVTIAGGGMGPRVVLVNDTGTTWTERLVVRLVDVGAPDATPAAALERDVEVPAHDSVEIAVDAARRPGALVAVADVGARRATRWLVPDLELELGPQLAEPAVTWPESTLAEVTVTAATLLRDLCLLAELAAPDAVVAGQLVTLLPGESAVVRVRFPDDGQVPSDAELTELLWSDNRLRHTP
jgi:beta-mannosidase